MFVFVVCGSDEHINTLNFSLKALKHFSANDIIVLTDSSRNSGKIEHDQIVDISTPSGFNHHQASIFLKTSLHRYVDLKYNYCYLDSDVIALNSGVDNVFNFSRGPVTFAADHCTFNSFSPYAVHCGCQERKNDDQKNFIQAVKSVLHDYEHDVVFDSEKGRELYRVLSDIREHPLKNYKMIFNYLMIRYIVKNSNRIFHWGGGFKYSSRKKGWIDLQGNLIMYNLTSVSKDIKKISEYHFNRRKMEWVNERGDNIFFTRCNHLTEMINRKFGLSIPDKDFQHWNGGVFLFNKHSVDFLENWHSKTMEIFKDNKWKTRDQGTLAATMWEFGLQEQELLPEEFNFIADYYNPKITYKPGNGFTKDNFKNTISPHFIHVYHQFGNEKWDVWQRVSGILTQGNIIEKSS